MHTHTPDGEAREYTPLYITYTETAEWLLSREDFLILCHANPDGDTLGAAFGLSAILTQLGKRAYCVCASPIPWRLGEITGDRVSLTVEELPADFTPRTVISVDIASPSLMGAYEARYGVPGVVDLAIDHHGTHTPFAKQILLRPDFAACAEVIFDLGQMLLGWSLVSPPTPEAAIPLYIGMSTDSGSFKYTAVTPATHQRAAVLLASGIEQGRITARLYGSRPIEEVYAAKAAYEDLRFYFDNRVTLVTFTPETMETYGLKDEDIGDIVNLIRGIRGVRVAIHLKPRGEGVFKVSMRSEEGINVARICARFEGGGHPQAAGCTLNGTKEEAERCILSAVAEALSGKEDGCV